MLAGEAMAFASPSPSASADSALQRPQDAPLKIGIVGFGNFGQFLAKTFIARGHLVYGISRTDQSAAAKVDPDPL